MSLIFILVSIMGYDHNLFYTNASRCVSRDAFNRFSHQTSKILLKWYRQHANAADACLDLSSKESDFRPSDVGHNDCILRILRSGMTDADKIARLDALWQTLDRVLINSTTSSGIAIPRSTKCDWCDDLMLVFTKTACVQPFDELCVAIFSAAEHCSSDWKYTSDGDDELLAAGRKLAQTAFEECRAAIAA